MTWQFDRARIRRQMLIGLVIVPIGGAVLVLNLIGPSAAARLPVVLMSVAVLVLVLAVAASDRLRIAVRGGGGLTADDEGVTLRIPGRPVVRVPWDDVFGAEVQTHVYDEGGSLSWLVVRLFVEDQDASSPPADLLASPDPSELRLEASMLPCSAESVAAEINRRLQAAIEPR